MCNVRFGFCDILNNQGLSKLPWAWLFWISQNHHPIIIYYYYYLGGERKDRSCYCSVHALQQDMFKVHWYICITCCITLIFVCNILTIHYNSKSLAMMCMISTYTFLYCTYLCCYLVYSPQAALDWFAMKRFYDDSLGGVTQPSQRRSVI